MIDFIILIKAFLAYRKRTSVMVVPLLLLAYLVACPQRCMLLSALQQLRVEVIT